MPGRRRGSSKLLVTVLLAVAFACGAVASLARPAPEVAVSSSTARVIAGSPGVQVVISRAADVESRAPRRGSSPFIGAVAVIIAGLGALRRRPDAVHAAWGSTSGGTGRAHDRAPPVAVTT